MTLMKSSFFRPLLLILLSSSSSSSNTVSEPGSVVSRTYRHFKRTFTWQDAQTYCRKNFTDMAIIYEDRDLDGMSVEHYLSWVNLATNNDQFPNRNWSLTAGNPLPFPNWATSQNQNIDRCAYLNTNNNKVYLAGCEHHFFFHCYESNSHSYDFSKTTMKWEKTREICKIKEKVLLPFSPVNFVLAESHPIWIGLQRKGDDWKWSSGSSDYRRWGEDEPKPHYDCVYITSKGKKMATRNCSESLPCICVSDNLVLVKEEKTWEEALEHCRAMHSQDDSNAQYDLVSVQPGNDQDYIMITVRKADMEEVWVGLRFLAGTWLWTTGADMLHAHLPKCPSEWRHCGVLSVNNGGSLEARDCAERKYFLCYKKNLP